jgi:hypothetical protein
MAQDAATMTPTFSRQRSRRSASWGECVVKGACGTSQQDEDVATAAVANL